MRNIGNAERIYIYSRNDILISWNIMSEQIFNNNKIHKKQTLKAIFLSLFNNIVATLYVKEFTYFFSCIGININRYSAILTWAGETSGSREVTGDKLVHSSKKKKKFQKN